ncbi:kinase-like domain-containing protein [Phellopilus nigrolimitatus]|nr:kinase-like domain-containing protein [Phellopilus nigrolimitatus]
MNHYYIVFDCVTGGQILDYIISHGPLCERVARKVSRQIGPALDYCNATISCTATSRLRISSSLSNSKIVDFGLSNLNNPVAHLSTFFRSLCFAAPELLNANVFAVPQVNIQSFGRALRARLRQNALRQPAWPRSMRKSNAASSNVQTGSAQTEYKHLLTRMLIVNPSACAALAEILSHPWMICGHGSFPGAHMLHREPLRADELDCQVIRGMSCFEFGTEDEIERKFFDVLKSGAAARAVQVWERRRQAPRHLCCACPLRRALRC